MIRTERFYSLREWKEYAITFMENATFEVDDNNVKVVTHRGRILGKWLSVGVGTLKERRSPARLAARND